MNKEVIVLGGSGFLGSHVSDELTKRNYNVTIADIKPSKYLKDNQVFKECDILSEEDINNVISDSTHAVYNFAAISELDVAIKEPKKTFEVNVMGQINISSVCQKRKVKRLIYASSAYAYSQSGSFYGISKYSTEKILREFYKQNKLPYTVIRYGSLYGNRATSSNTIYKLIHMALTKQKMTLQGSGEEVREYIHAYDAARLSVDILESDKYINEHVILTGIEKMKQKDLLVMIAEMFHNQIEISFLNKPHKGHYQATPYSYHPDVAVKLVANPFIDIGQGIVEYIQEMAAERDKSNT